MAPSRRDFIKFVVAGSVAAGCPIDETLLATPDLKAPLGAAISVCILIITVALLFLSERLEKRWSFK